MSKNAATKREHLYQADAPSASWVAISIPAFAACSLKIAAPSIA
jgi:hypothetical protein